MSSPQRDWALSPHLPLSPASLQPHGLLSQGLDRSVPNPYIKCSGLPLRWNSRYDEFRHYRRAGIGNNRDRSLLHPTSDWQARGVKRNEEFSLDDRRSMRRRSMFYRMGSKAQASGGGACGAPGGSLVGSPYRCLSLWRTGLRPMQRRAYSCCSRTCAPQYPQCRSRRSRQAGNTRCVVDCIQRAVRRWH